MLVIGPAMTAIIGLASGLPVDARASGPAPNLVALAKPPVNWHAVHPPTVVAGEALFTVINGGATLYMQYGFRRAVFATFQNPQGRIVNLEIYEMVDANAARNVFDQKAGSSGRKIPYGREARLEAHYLNFWRGRYQVTLSGYAATPENMAALRSVAAMVDKRLPDG
jgi:hypothetical protein